jgi:hypothetical protein
MENFYYAEKARHFEDPNSWKRIVSAQTGAKAKEYGKAIRPCREAEWINVAPDLLIIGLKEKFRQNPALLQLIVESGSRSFHEASLHDGTWGMKLCIRSINPEIKPVFTGLNLMGKLLDRARLELKTELHIITE